MYVVDASVWVSRFMRTDRYHEPSSQWLLSRIAEGETFIGPAVLLPEIGGPLARISGQPSLARRIVSLVEQSNNVTLVSVDSSLARFSADLAVELRLRGADALYVALAQRLSIPLVTWDQEQLQRGTAAVTALTPELALG